MTLFRFLKESRGLLNAPYNIEPYTASRALFMDKGVSWKVENTKKQGSYCITVHEHNFKKIDTVVIFDNMLNFWHPSFLKK